MNGIVALKKAKKYAQDSLEGQGALKGDKGDPGKDGITPHIGDNNNWFIGTQDTGVKAKGENGEDGVSPYIGDNGNWYIGDYNTNVKANGDDGDDGFTPIISENSGNTDSEYRLKITNKNGEIITPNLKGIQGLQGIPGKQGKPGNDGKQGIQGIKGDKGDDGYPFLIYKEYTSLDNFNDSDFPEIGLMFMIKAEDATTLPVYRYTGETENPYSFVTNLSGSEGIKGDKGDPGKDGEQGIAGQNGKDGTTYTPTIGTVTSVASTQNPTASVIIDETEKTAKFNFGIPNGKDGTDGFTPTIKENDNNTDDCYCLDITNKDKSFTTPNLIGVIGKEYKNKSIGTPVGEIISYMGTIAPENYLICDGTVYQIAHYPILAQHFADNFGSKNFFGGDGTTTFAVPDLRGEFLRGSGTATRNSGSGAVVGVHQEPSRIRNVWSSLKEKVIVHYFSSNTESGNNVVNPDKNGPASVVDLENSISRTYTNTSNVLWNTVRPTNTSVLYCIKYQPTYWITSTNLNEAGTV